MMETDRRFTLCIIVIALLLVYCRIDKVVNSVSASKVEKRNREIDENNNFTTLLHPY